MKFTALLAICFVSGCSETATNAQGFDRRNQTETTSPVAVTVVTPQLETPGDEDLEPIITFETLAGSSGQLIRSKATVTKPWLVSEPWCANCPPAKARFLASGNKNDHVITIAEALEKHGKRISSIPAEYTAAEIIELIQPPSYRSVGSMKWALNNQTQPSKSTILKHLRGGGPHSGKQWQAWHLESWKTQQLYALHDDDHDDAVPTFDIEAAVVATVANADSSPETFAAVVALHLMRQTGDAELPVGALFDVTVNVEQSWKNLAKQILTSKQMEFPDAGLSIDWTGQKRSLEISTNAISIQPPVKVTLKKWKFTYSAGLNGLAFTDDLSSVTLDLSGAPDITIRLVSQ
mgnify:CR=1 FL=1|tara:strand:+ start:646 stop:1692 length:1047 start_codon:yes stop_codon:yes gene_type:complete